MKNRPAVRAAAALTALLVTRPCWADLDFGAGDSGTRLERLFDNAAARPAAVRVAGLVRAGRAADAPGFEAPLYEEPIGARRAPLIDRAGPARDSVPAPSVPAAEYAVPAEAPALESLKDAAPEAAKTAAPPEVKPVDEKGRAVKERASKMDRASHYRLLREWAELEAEKQRYADAMLGKFPSTARWLGDKALKFAAAAAGILMAYATVKIDYSLLHQMYNDLYANVFGAVPPEFLASARSLAMQSLIFVASAHLAYSRLSEKGRMAYTHAMWTIGMVGAAMGGAIVGADAVAKHVADAGPLLDAKPALMTGMVASAAWISTGVGGIAGTKATDAIFRLLGSTEKTTDERAHLEALDRRIAAKEAELRALHEKAPELDQESFAGVAIDGRTGGKGNEDPTGGSGRSSRSGAKKRASR